MSKTKKTSKDTKANNTRKTKKIDKSKNNKLNPNPNPSINSLDAKNICNYYYKKNEDLLDLSKIKISKQNKITYNKNGKIITFQNIKDGRALSEGTFGVVYELKSLNSNDRIVVKIFKREGESTEEINAIKFLEDNNINCKIINSIPGYYYHSSGNKEEIILMNKMDGDLYDIKGILRKNYISSFVSELIKMFHCLAKNGVGYLDIKLNNLLYKCITDTKLILRIGDIGSIGLLNAAPPTYTFKAYENRFDKHARDVIITQKNMVFVLGITILSLLDKSDDVERFFSRKRIHKKTMKEVREFVENKNKTLGLDKVLLNNKQPCSKLIKNMLEPKVEKRMDLDQLMIYLNISS